MNESEKNLARYQRQMVFAPLGLIGQRSLLAKRVLVVGVGGLGSWSANLLARSGVGMLRLVDGDCVQLDNLHRQDMYDQADAAEETPKVQAAASYLRKANSQVVLDARQEKLDKDNIASLADGMDLILDGTDNFATRFIINDYAVKMSRPWIFAGVVGAEAQVMTIAPPHTPCLRCISQTPPPPCVDPNCRIAGVLGPAVAMIASIQAMEAIKILSGNSLACSPYLLKIDLWKNEIQRLDVGQSCADYDCPCCKRRQFDYLEAQ
jgi:molybdopterin/thiamine biosynthesis adenylyltransferase